MKRIKELIAVLDKILQRIMVLLFDYFVLLSQNGRGGDATLKIFLMRVRLGTKASSCCVFVTKCNVIITYDNVRY